MIKIAIRSRSPQFVASALMIVALAFGSAAAPSIGHAGETRAPARLMVKPKPPVPAKEVFIRSKPHVNVGAQHPALKRLKSRPGRPSGPGNLSAPIPVLADWYCGEGAGPGGHAVCTQDLIDSCSGTYVPPKTNGEHQTWGMCHESTG